MAMASLSASLLVRKGSAQPVSTNQAEPHNRIQFIPQLHKEKPRANNQNNATKEAGPHILNKAKKRKGSSSSVKNSKRKSVRLAAATDKGLRLLAAGMGVSQQSIMEKAIKDHLTSTFNDRGCICRPSR